MDSEGHMLEGCATNLFAVIDDHLVTHPLDHQVLGGIMREMVLRQAKSNGMSVVERPWKLSESGISECMMSSTTNALLPVCQIDGKAVDSGSPGPVANQLRQLLLAELEALRNR